MANTVPGISTKILILLILAVALFFYDIPAWRADFQNPGVQATFLLALSIFVLGIFLKRNVISISLETSEIGFGRGLLFVATGAVLYVYGSYTSAADWFHFESLLLFVVGYVALRVGTGVIRTLLPLLLILAISFVPTNALNPSLSAWLILSVALFDGLAFFLFVGARPKQFLMPVILICAALGLWIGSADRGIHYLLLLIPIPLLLLAIPRIRKFVELTSSLGTPWCFAHHTMPNGFCSFCGMRVASASTPENFGGWGLLAICGVVALLVASSVPILTISSGSVFDGSYTARRAELTALPITPGGWQVNSTSLNSWNPSTGTFETVRTYVPLVQPEAENYTVYYSVSPGLSVPKAPSGANVSGWRWISSALTPMAGFYQGRLTTYTHANATMLSYGGSRTMTFWSGAGFVNDYVTIGYVREFKNTKISADTTLFLTDLQSTWTPALANDQAYSAWATFISGMTSTLSGLLPALEVLASVSLFGWIAYRVTKSEESLDRFYSSATMTNEKNWSVLLEMLKTPRKARPGSELMGPEGQVSQDVVERALKTLAKDGLVRPRLVSAGDDVRLFWKVRA